MLDQLTSLFYRPLGRFPYAVCGLVLAAIARAIEHRLLYPELTKVLFAVVLAQLTVARLRSAGWSPALIILSAVPVATNLLFAVLSLVPPADCCAASRRERPVSGAWFDLCHFMCLAVLASPMQWASYTALLVAMMLYPLGLIAFAMEQIDAVVEWAAPRSGGRAVAAAVGGPPRSTSRRT